MRIKEVNGFLKSILSENVIGITLAPFGIYLDVDHLSDKYTINHESIHWKQQVEMLIIPFYIWYGVEWLWKIIIYGKRVGYYCISFEREAYKRLMRFGQFSRFSLLTGKTGLTG